MSEGFYEMLNSIAFIHPTSVFKRVWGTTLAAQKWTKTFLILFLFQIINSTSDSMFQPSPFHGYILSDCAEVIGWGD